MKRLLLGDEALALGAINAGLSGVYAYPGTPSTEITEFIQKDTLAKERCIHSRWCTNEKTAMEAALGMSFAGKRALVCMKHVGMNVCADAFVNSAVTGVNGGLVVVAADDPSMHSSQNEQDSRFYAKFAMVPVFEPCNQQEVYDMIEKAFSLSEELKTPVLFRMVTRLAHSRASVEVKSPSNQNGLAPSDDRGWVLLPAIARRQYLKLIEKQSAILEASENSKFNCSYGRDSEIAILACGVTLNYVEEAIDMTGYKAKIFKLSQYPIPTSFIDEIRVGFKKILVLEDGQPVMEEELRAALGPCFDIKGRLSGDLPRTGELTPDSVAKALGLNQKVTFEIPGDVIVPRPPQLCPGCGHRDVYKALNEVIAEFKGGKVFGDIGCYTLGALPPFNALASCVDMGASITMAKGASDAGVFPAVAVIGDSTFTHSGMTGLLDAANENAPITVVISDNLTTAMTGGQDSAGTSKYEAICVALGVSKEHVRVVVPLPANMEEITSVIRNELSYKGLSVIISRRECMQTLKRHKK